MPDTPLFRKGLRGTCKRAPQTKSRNPREAYNDPLPHHHRRPCPRPDGCRSAAKGPASHFGLNAHAQAIETVIEGVPADRVQALRDCNNQVAGFTEYTWHNTHAALYRSCMANHGQPE